MNKRVLKIAIVVHGRFHAFQLADSLIKQGHDVTLFTNYPKSAVLKYGISNKNVQSFLFHGIASRLIHRVFGSKSMEKILLVLFSRWAASRMSREEWDVAYYFSGVGFECLMSPIRCKLKLLARGSAHIEAQDRLLAEEEQRAKAPVERPGTWMIQREKREYELADAVIVLSTFAKNTFLEQRFNKEKIRCFSLGADLRFFGADRQIIERRKARILSGKPIRVLMTGNFTYQKGVIDLVEIARALKGRFEFHFVGEVSHQMQKFVKDSDSGIEFIPKQSEFDLPEFYHWADLFLFTTIQDGFAVVLCQAQASGLPILATANCSAPDILSEGKNGWVLPIRNPKAFIERLEWCDAHRLELAAISENIFHSFKAHDWSESASEFIQIAYDLLRKKEQVQAGG